MCVKRKPKQNCQKSYAEEKYNIFLDFSQFSLYCRRHAGDTYGGISSSFRGSWKVLNALLAAPLASF
jgi:hypothetical protein